MFYFIPSWYQEDRQWYFNTESWYLNRGESRFDDVINQVRMFYGTKEASQLLVLNYSPHLRYFMHRQAIFDVPYWSAFDELQGIAEGTPVQKTLDVKELGWPETAQLIYNSQYILAYDKGRLLARVQLGTEGYVQAVDYLDAGGGIQKTFVFDDRGFASSILYYEDGQPHHQDYLDLAGRWRVREYLIGNEQVEINPATALGLSQLTYPDMTSLMLEVLTKRLAMVRKTDTLILAAHRQHEVLLERLVGRVQLVTTFFQNRYPFEPTEALAELLLRSRVILVDTEATKTKLLETFDWRSEQLPVYQVSPFDTRLKLGTSQRIKEQKVFLMVNNLSSDAFEEFLDIIFAKMMENPWIDLILGIPYAEPDIIQRVYQALKEFIKAKGGYEDKIVVKNPHELPMFGLGDEAEEKPRENVVIAPIDSEEAVIKVLEDIRLIVDIGETPDLFLQIAGISAGIPQINRLESTYVRHKKNGFIIKSLDELPKAVDYYFTSLFFWNESLVYSVQQITRHTSGRIVEQWKKLLAGGKDG